MIELSLNQIVKYYGATKVLEDITFEAKTGERIGIVGRNGTGKTTIFKVISAIEEYNGGTMSIRKGSTVGYLDQIPEYSEGYRVIDVLNTAFKKTFKIKSKMQDLEKKMSSTSGNELNSIMKKYGELQNIFEHMGGYEIDEKISKVSSGLKLSDEFKEKKFINLSGGEKTTVILGKILLQNPDILLLDEPSNHLDIESVEWLEEFLKEYKGTVLIISHDRYFLDMVATRIVEVEDMKTNIYEGNYSYYVEEKERRILAQYEDYKNQQKKIRAMEDAIKRFREWGTKADNADMFVKMRNMQKRIDRMEKIDRPILERKQINLNFSVQKRSGKDVIMIDNLIKAFGNNVVIDGLKFHVRYGEKVALLGKNGSGKSTLIKIIMGEYQKDRGEVKLGSSVKIGYLDQNIQFKNENQTVLETFREVHTMPEGNARRILASFLFYGEDVFKKVCDLSGGEKSRLKLCILMQKDINLLVLDEPTNHLDIDSSEMLEVALKEFQGTILFISHDRYFINKIAEKISEIRDKKLFSYVGDYNYYKKKKNQAKIRQEDKNKVLKSKEKKSNISKSNNKANNKKKSHISVDKLEGQISELEEVISLKEKEMEKYATNQEKLTKIYEEKNILEDKLNILIEKWTEVCN